MGSLDEARAATAAFQQQAGQCVSQLQSTGQSINAAQQSLRGRLGSTQHAKVVEAEARCREAAQKVAEAIGSLNAAKEAVNQFGTSLH